MGAADDGTPRGRAWRIAATTVVGVALVVGALIGWRAVVGTETLAVREATGPERERLAGQRVFFGHQSVGANLLDGLEALRLDGVSIVETTDPRMTGPGIVAHSFVGHNGDAQSKIDEFTDILDAGMADAVDLAMLKLCYTDVNAGIDARAVFDSYSAAIDALAERHPEVTFLVVTVPVTADRDLKEQVKGWLGRADEGMGPAGNLAREQFNSLIRARYAGTGRLLDIAAVESGFDQAPTLRRADGGEYFVLHASFSSDPGHLNDLGARAAASEFIRVLAAAGP